jgi:hypothetical protein
LICTNLFDQIVKSFISATSSSKASIVMLL